MNITIRPEKKSDYDAISRLVYESFKYGTNYTDGKLERQLVEKIRRGKYYVPELALVAESDREMVGYFMLSGFPINDSHSDEMLLLSPVAVEHNLLRKGIGTQMLKQGIQKAKEMGYKGIIVEGNPDFYHIFGFNTSSKLGIYPDEHLELPFEECLMAMELYDGALKDISGSIDFHMYGL